MSSKLIDLTGKVFGCLTVIKRAENRNKAVYWLCKCECGNTKEILGKSLKNSDTTSCGCVHRKIVSAMKANDLTGQQFGRLTAIKSVGRRKSSFLYWLCQCECGNTKEIMSTSLTSGKTTSCGCLAIERFSDIVAKDKLNIIIDDTNVHLLARKKPNKNNTTGVIGVYKYGNGFVAKIAFKKKTYNLGVYSTLEAAAEARKKAEDRLHGEFLEWYYGAFPPEKKKANN